MLKNFDSVPTDRRSNGWTLVELMVASAASILVMASLMTIMYYTMRSFQAVGNYGEMNQTSRYALDIMNRDIRGASSVLTYTSDTNGYITSMTFSNSDASTIAYTWNSAATTFTRNYTNGVSSLSKVLLTNCDNFTFSIWQRTPGNGLTFTAATNASQIKILYVDWKCSRRISGAKENTESVQTAQITMRN